MQRGSAALAEPAFDVVIVGGGINGAESMPGLSQRILPADFVEARKIGIRRHQHQAVLNSESR